MGRENAVSDPHCLPQEPDITDLLRQLARSVELHIRTHVPATVVTYDPTRQKATVTVQQLQVVRVTDATRLPATMTLLSGTPPNATATLSPIQLVDVPVAWPRTAAGYQTLPLAAGDTGEIHVSDRSLAAWLQAGIPVDPQMAWTHALQDSVFHPGLHPDTAPITPATDLTATVIEGAQVKIGRSAVSAITKAEELILAFDAALAAAITAAPGGGADGGAAALTAFQSSWAAAKNTIKAIKGKVE